MSIQELIAPTLVSLDYILNILGSEPSIVNLLSYFVPWLIALGSVAVGAGAFVGPAFQKNSCHSCKDQSENWLCLICGATSCSRHVNGHGGEHAEATGHPIACSFSDLSVWCYQYVRLTHSRF